MSNSEKEPSRLYMDRILTMMRDYKIPMSEAIKWDYEGFPPPDIDLLLSPEEDFLLYLHRNYLNIEDAMFFVGIVMGYEKDLRLNEKKEEDQQANASSTEGARSVPSANGSQGQTEGGSS